jgi:hypothetical protein
VAPVAVGEDAELAGGDELLHLLLHRGEGVPRVAGPGEAERVGEGGRLLRGGLEHLRHVHPVERRELVEVHDVVVQGVRADEDVADELRVERDLQAERVLHRADRGDRVHRRADAADALGEDPGVARVAPPEDGLDAAPHGPAGPRVLDRAALHLDVDAEVTLDPRDGIDRDELAHGG